MSRESAVAKRYAKALFELAKEQNIVAEAEQQLKLVVEALDSDEEVRKFLAFPSINVDQKIAFIRQAVAGQVSDAVLNTIELIVTRGRQAIIGEVSEAYTKVAGEALGQAQATVYTAQLLSDEELAKVAEKFGQLAGKNIIATQVVNADLLGGVQVRIGDRLYDGSLSGKLARLEKQLKSQAL